MDDALFLRHATLAHGALADDERPFSCALIPFRGTRVAMVLRSKTAPYDSARLAIFNTSDRAALPVFTPLGDAIGLATHGEADEVTWGGAWSPDGRLLVVHGTEARVSDGKPEPVVWVLTNNAWIEDQRSDSNQKMAPYCVLRVEPRELLASDAPWRASPSAKAKPSAASSIQSVFFHAKSSSRCFLVTQDGWILSLSIDVAPLLVQARSSGRVDVGGAFVKMQSVTRVTNWHAGVTAVAFDSASSTLVISGGLKNPSDELRAQGASSLSAWQVTTEDPFVELLDYTMVMRSHESMVGSVDSSALELHDPVAAAQSSGIMSKMRHSFLNPLKMLHGDEEDGPTLHGSIHQLAISSDGVFLSIVNQEGQFCIRQIDACADVVQWQYAQGIELGQQVAVSAIAWLGPSSMVFLTRDCTLIYGFLASGENGLQGDDEGGEVSQTTVQVVPQCVVSDLNAQQRSVQAFSVWAACSEDEVGTSSRFTLHDFSLSNRAREWCLTTAANSSVTSLIQSLVDLEQFDRALEIVETYRHGKEWKDVAIDLDHVYQQMWAKYRASATLDHIAPATAVLDSDSSFHGCNFEKAIARLNAVEHNKGWVVNECFQVVASDSLLHMKEILTTGLRALRAMHSDGRYDPDRATLLRYLYRLDTLNELIIAELDEEDRRTLADEQCFDGAVFITFRDAPIVDVACGFAKEGRIEALSVLFRRNGYNLLPHRTRILELLPASISPYDYCHLIPAIGSDSNEEWQFYALVPSKSSACAINEVYLLPENRTHDLSIEEVKEFEECARRDPNHRRDEYALWFTNRMVELDSIYGQLGSAFQLGRCGRAGLLDPGIQDSEFSGTALVTSTPFEEFLEHSERFYRCVHDLHLPACRESSLEEWSLFSLHDQIMAVVTEEHQLSPVPVGELLSRLRLVFLELRRHDFALDEVVSWLCQVLMSTRLNPSSQDMLRKLELCAQLIHLSNPAIEVSMRWIQDDARLLRTAIDIIFAASVPESDSDTEAIIAKERHQRFVDQLWLIFQSLPERKPTDPPSISPLQVEVDGMEDLLIATDVLGNYNILTCPSLLRSQVADEAQGVVDSQEFRFSLDLTERVCSFGLHHSIPWSAIWQDVMKLKTHVFGGRVTQDHMLSILLRRLIESYGEGEDQETFLADADELISNWVTLNVSAISIPIDILLGAIRSRSDEGKEEESSQLVALARSVLALPVVAETEAAHPICAKFEAVMSQEQSHMHIRELVELLTYGAVKVSRSRLRELCKEQERLDLILQVFVSNPSNYKMSTKAQVWLRTQQNLSPDQPLDIVLDGIMHLAQLLHIQQSHRTRIVLKAAYSALYCLDFDSAHRLACHVIIQFDSVSEDVRTTGEERSEEMTLLLSLVLDLVSSSSFRSWEKKIDLIKSLLTVNDSALLAHPISDLLFERVYKLEAIQTLANELGLTEIELEERREQDPQQKMSAEDALLKELEIVVDLLREEAGQRRRDDREFVFRLLQKGFQLAIVVEAQAKAPLTSSSPTAKALSHGFNQSNAEMGAEQRIPHVVHQLAMLAFQDAHARLSESDEGRWKPLMEIGFSYLLLWLQFEVDPREAFKRAWHDEILPLCRREQNKTDEPPVSSDEIDRATESLFIRSFQHFFTFIAASYVATEKTTELSDLRDTLAKLRYSFSATQHYVESQPELETDTFEKDEGEASARVATGGEVIELFLSLAKQCQELLHSQKANQELEAVATFMNDDVDLEQFSSDPDYRLAMIRRMSAKKENLPAAREFAAKYGIDEYECVLAYIWHAFFPDERDSSGFSRQEQLEHAFRGADETSGDDFLEQALQRPLAFGEFLLRSDSGIYESLPGTDHVGILLVLRSILECSKRVASASESDSASTVSSLPLLKTSSDRVTLLFMCLKRLKEISSSDNDGPDFKLVCGARTTDELLHGAVGTFECQTVAMSAIAPFLTSKSIKMLTKVLQKLHQMSPSAIVMVFLNDMLSKIWDEQQQRGIAPSGDLATYAYESCMPFLSVLSIDHLSIFQRRFVKCIETEEISSQFYGLNLLDLTGFGSSLTAGKRMEIISEILSLLQSRAETKASSDDELVQQMLQAQEEELIEAAFWFVVDCIAQSDQFDLVGETSDGRSEQGWFIEWKTLVTGWFALSAKEKAAREDQILNAFVMFCERATSLDLATLPVELALGLITPPDFVSRAVQDIYCKGVSDVIHKALAREGSDERVRDLVSRWATSLVSTFVDDEPRSPFEELKEYVSALEPQNGSTAVSTAKDDEYRNILNHLECLASPVVRVIISKRKEKLDSVADEATSLRTAVISQWKAVIAQYEEQQNWMTSALLSDVLIQSAVVSVEDRQYDFGLRVKAVIEWLSHHHSSDLWSPVLALSTADVFSQFAGQVFYHLLAAVETSASHATLPQQLTIALASWLRSYAEIAGSFDASAAQRAWKHEKEKSLETRLRQGDDVNGSEALSAKSGLESARMWNELLVRGSWDERLMQWYTFVAYDKLDKSAPVAEYVRVRGDANPALTIMLLLVCPFQELRDEHQPHILITSKQLLLSPTTTEATKMRLLELLLLRFDLQVLLSVDGFDTLLLTFHTERSTQVSKRAAVSWTSTAEYYVCRLVLLKEYAAAGRLVCALWNVHPMLWDLENARLVLGNFLGALAKQSTRSSTQVGEAVKQARIVAFEHYQRELV